MSWLKKLIFVALCVGVLPAWAQLPQDLLQLRASWAHIKYRRRSGGTPSKSWRSRPSRSAPPIRDRPPP